MRKDYGGGEGRRENTWNEAKTHRADKFLEAGQLLCLQYKTYDFVAKDRCQYQQGWQAESAWHAGTCKQEQQQQQLAGYGSCLTLLS